MKRKIVFDSSKNPAMNFVLIERDLIRIANENGDSIAETIDKFIMDIQNLHNDDYEKSIGNIDIFGDISEKILNSLIAYMNKAKKNHKQKESKEAKKEQQKSKSEEFETEWNKVQQAIDTALSDKKQGTELEILDKLILDIKKGNSGYEFDNKLKKQIIKRLQQKKQELKDREEEEKRQQEERGIQQRNLEKAMQQIEGIVEREYGAGNVKNKVSYLTIIRNSIAGKTKNSNLNIAKVPQEELLQMLDKRISEEKDELYYEQVRHFTKDFEFLRDYPEVARGLKGARKAAFTDKESYERYCALRTLLQKEYDEHERINELLNSKKIGKADRRILTARKGYMNREIEYKRKIGEIR